MKITKNVTRGFTLIELLVVIAIIGLLSTIITGPIQNGLKKGRDAKKIGDMMAIKNALAQYAVDNNGVFPVSLDGLTPGGYLSALPVSAATTTNAKDKIMYNTYTVGGAIASYHLGVALEAQNPVLASDADCVAGCGISSVTNGFSNFNATQGGVTGTALTLSASSDFIGTDTTSACVMSGSVPSQVSNCIFDITP